jgi:hypothetical protein
MGKVPFEAKLIDMTINMRIIKDFQNRCVFFFFFFWWGGGGGGLITHLVFNLCPYTRILEFFLLNNQEFWLQAEQ